MKNTEEAGPCCGAWKAGIAEISEVIVACSLRENKQIYSAPIFKFCPWCGASVLRGRAKVCDVPS